MKVNLSTPENALHSLETAYVYKDIEGAVAAKDFSFEAKQLLLNLKNLANADEALINQTAEVLELAFRKEIETRGFPDFASLKCTILEKKEIRPGLMEMVEECTFLHGGKSRDKVHAVKSVIGWRIVVLPE